MAVALYGRGGAAVGVAVRLIVLVLTFVAAVLALMVVKHLAGIPDEVARSWGLVAYLLTFLAAYEIVGAVSRWARKT